MQQQLHFRQGRARYLRARRTRATTAAMGVDAAAAAAAAGVPSSSAAAGSAPMATRGALAAGVRQVRVDVAPSAVLAAGASVLPWAPHSDAHPSLVPVVAGAGGSGTWQAPSTVTFTMGWWEAPAKKGERRRRQQQRLSSSLMQPARALGAGANAPLMQALPVAH